MTILSLRTDKPEAEIGLLEAYVKGQTSHKDSSTEINVRGLPFHIEQLVYEIWQTDRKLAETIHSKLSKILNKLNKNLDNIDGIVCFKGPGSFTGLRIGLTIANALAYAQNIPVVAMTDPDWLEKGIQDLINDNPLASGDKIAIPEYGAEVKTTKPRK